MRYVWYGVSAAVAVAVAGWALLQFITALTAKSFVAQETIGGIMSIIAVGFVTWMIFWMRKASRTIAGELRELIDFELKDESGELKVAEVAHVRLAHPSMNGGAELLRRGYNFVDGSDGLGRLDAGLFFLAYQRDPRRQFIPIQQQLSRSDVMNEYIRHVGSGIYACPGGIPQGSFWGEKLFA
jgi:hypothetical protein